MGAKLNIEEFRTRFMNEPFIRVSNIHSFYQERESNIELPIIYLRIKTLVEQGVLQRIGRGVYKVGKNEIFVPTITPLMVELEKIIRDKFLNIKYCQWDLSCVNHFSQHLINFNVHFIDVEREVLGSMYYELKEHFPKVMQVHQLYDTISEFKDTIIVRPLVSESPIQKTAGTFVATLEKILVDFITDKELISFQGYEGFVIFQTAFKKYTLNRNTILRYAARKNKKEIITEILENIESAVE